MFVRSYLVMAFKLVGILHGLVTGLWKFTLVAEAQCGDCVATAPMRQRPPLFLFDYLTLGSSFEMFPRPSGGVFWHVKTYLRGILL
jgi:hypothetical protein